MFRNACHVNVYHCLQIHDILIYNDFLGLMPMTYELAKTFWPFFDSFGLMKTHAVTSVTSSTIDNVLLGS